jgi:hypothetical protein
MKISAVRHHAGLKLTTKKDPKSGLLIKGGMMKLLTQVIRSTGIFSSAKFLFGKRNLFSSMRTKQIPLQSNQGPASLIY